MRCALKLVFTTCFLFCRHSPCSGDLDGKTSQINSIVMMSIGTGILVALLALICVTSCLYFKVAKALKTSKPPFCLALKSHPSMVTQDKITAAPSITAGCYPGLQFCEQCPLYTDFDSLPPCFCDVNEGL